MSYKQALHICAHLINVVTVWNIILKLSGVFANLNVVAKIANIHLLKKNYGTQESVVTISVHKF